jgi:hypothetical protein
MAGWAALVGAALALIPASRGQDQFVVSLRDGSILQAGIDLGTIPWRRIGPNGTVTDEALSLDSVTRIELARRPASRQLIEIRQHLSHLQSENYHVRNQAEAALIKLGGPFQSVIAVAQQTDNAEVRYRVGRVLKRLGDKNTKRVDAEYDVVTLTDGESVSGDLDFERLSLQFRDQALQLPRDAIAAIAHADRYASPSLPRPTQTQVFSKPGDSFFQPGDFLVDFDTGRLNETFNKFEEINEAFVHRGVRLTADCGAEPAVVVTAGFVVDTSRSKRNSAATLIKQRNKKYEGSIRIAVCEPGLAHLPATVHRVGCYSALVNHPRDFVLEAYSASGDIVAVAESLEKAPFVGVESSIPIAYVWLKPNRHLKVDPQELDQTFVFDDLTFDPPRATPTVTQAERATIWLRDGSRLLCTSLDFNGQTFQARGAIALGTDGAASSFDLPPNEVVAVSLAVADPAPRKESLWGYFADGCCLPLEVGRDGMRTADFDEWAVAQDDLAGVFGGQTTPRLPLSEDLTGQHKVVVLPTERWLIPEFKLTPAGIAWDESQAQLREVFHLENSTHTPDSTAAFTLPTAPSIWWRAPVPVADSSGWLTTLDGRTFAFGTTSQVGLEKLELEGILVSRAGQSLRIPWNQVAAIRFPDR